MTPPAQIPKEASRQGDWTTGDHDEGIVKCGEQVIGVAVDGRNAERFAVAHNIDTPDVYCELLKRAEYWRTKESDSHGIANAVYVALMEVAGCLSSKRNSSRAHGEKTKL